jgi:hypothetical protein
LHSTEILVEVAFYEASETSINSGDFDPEMFQVVEY